MTHHVKRPLVGPHSESSTFFLESNGFTNVPSCSEDSLWTTWKFSLYIPQDTVVVDYKPLFEFIYKQGLKDGQYMARKELKQTIKNKFQELFELD